VRQRIIPLCVALQIVIPRVTGTRVGTYLQSRTNGRNFAIKVGLPRYSERLEFDPYTSFIRAACFSRPPVLENCHTHQKSHDSYEHRPEAGKHAESMRRRDSIDRRNRFDSTQTSPPPPDRQPRVTAVSEDHTPIKVSCPVVNKPANDCTFWPILGIPNDRCQANCSIGDLQTGIVEVHHPGRYRLRQKPLIEP
jgi:hypothetical protein